MEKNGRFLQEGLVRLSSDKDVSAPIMVYVAGSKKLCANLVIEALYGFQFLARYHYSLLLLIILALIKSWCRQLLISVRLALRIGLREIRMIFQPGHIIGSSGRRASRTNRFARFL
jgi:hypothetical protein